MVTRDFRMLRAADVTLGYKTVALALLGGIFIGVAFGFVQHQRGETSVQSYGQSEIDWYRGEARAAKEALARVNTRLKMLKDTFLDAHPNQEEALALLEDMEKKVGSGGSIVVSTDLYEAPPIGVAPQECAQGLSHLPVADDGSALAAKLAEVAINNEVLVAVSNKNLAAPGFMLDMWIRSVQASGVKNFLVMCLDDETEHFVTSLGAPAVNMKEIIPQNHGTHNHAVSALKFRILERCLKLGYSILMSDVDILVFEDPFKHLVRDSDIESMSDGFDETTAYGYNDVFDDQRMGWSRYAHTMRIFVFNSGLFCVRATPGGLRAMQRTAEWLETKGGWDQAVFNEVIQFPSSVHRGTSPNATRRVMDIHKFVNSKTFFCFMRKSPNFKSKSRPVKPVMIHVNYHPDKFERLKGIRSFYVEGRNNALDKFPCGEKV